MGLVPFRQPSTLFCCCHLVLHIFCCIVENKPSLSLNVFKYFHGVNIYDIIRQTIPSVYYSWSEEIFANIVMETLIKLFIFVASGDCIGVEL